MLTRRSPIALLAILALACADSARQLPLEPLEPTGRAASLSFQFPGEDPGPPYYSVIERQFTPHTADWAAIPFVRDPQCIAPGFNLLDQIAVPQAFGCPLYVAGHVTYRNGPPPMDLAPIHAEYRDAAPVPVWFVSWSELDAAIADGVLTLPELSALPSLRIGSASFFTYNQHPGPERPHGAGNGKIEIVARGALQNGMSFSVQVREMGVDQVSVLRHVSIEFR
jgi:hypothetical protein